MAWTEIAGTCEQGPCPTFYMDDDGNVRVQGNRTIAHLTMPAHEDMVEIPAADWRKLIAQLGTP